MMSQQSKFIEPCVPIAAQRSPSGPDWVHEVKFDGYRSQLHKQGEEVLVYSRNGADFTRRFRTIAAALANFPVRSFILDGEIVANNAEGAPDFYTLHLRRSGVDISMWVFDILELNGVDLRSLPLWQRRQKLQQLVAKIDMPMIRLSETFDDPQKLLEVCEEHGLEGVVSKRRLAPYTSGRSRHWIKVKTAAWRERNRERYKVFER